MIRVLIIALGLSLSHYCFALSGQAYMERFNNYKQWSERLPINPPPPFLEFVQESTPLANKLRERWLYELARTKNWETYLTYYQPSEDLNLVCYYQTAKYNTGKQKEVVQESRALWLNPASTPPACNHLFDTLFNEESFEQPLITKRIALALEKNNLQLANNLLKQYKTPKPAEAALLNRIHRDTSQIKTLSKNELHEAFYLYGLKRMASLNMDKGLTAWKELKTKFLLKEAQQQAFLTHVAIYKAMRNDKDAKVWFAKIKPQYYTDTLIDWEIRLALKQQDWKNVTTLINLSKSKDTPNWQYWMARALEEQGQSKEARPIYEALAKQRHYYGFLASMRLNKAPSLEHEAHNTNMATLKPYQPVITQIAAFYQAKNSKEASRLLNDFISELPKEEASALVYWVDNKLQWHGKSIFLSTNETLNNQLALRFPLAYQSHVKQYAKQNALPPEFVYAIIRQESTFREDVVSSVGARGLMQVMPRTASIVSKSDKIAYKHQNQLFDWNKNIQIGSAYLKQLGKRFSNHPVLIAAAYNAGPRQVVYWLRSHPPKEIDLWIETLPWQETRNYLKNVMAFYVVYQYRLNQKSDLSRFLEPL